MLTTPLNCAGGGAFGLGEHCRYFFPLLIVGLVANPPVFPYTLENQFLFDESRECSLNAEFARLDSSLRQPPVYNSLYGVLSIRVFVQVCQDVVIDLLYHVDRVL